MATIQEITAMCRSGRITEAYTLAQNDYKADPRNIWTQRKVGWALFYMLKNDAESNNSDFYKHLEELVNLDLLTVQTDSMIFENILWKITAFLKNIPEENTEAIDKVFTLIKKYSFSSSISYSYLLQMALKFGTWIRLLDFFEWWDITKLLPKDYEQFQLENGRKIMSLAERVYIAYSKALLGLNNLEKIREFVPKIENLIDNHPDMLYPGYFCGQLKLAMGAEKEDALSIIIPFARKKKTEFWIWQLLSECYEEKEMQLACLLRATHCQTSETFLGKVRIKLIALYIYRGDYPRAKYHLEQVTRTYLQQGWRIPVNLQNWMNEKWVKDTTPDSTDGINYKQYTNSILSQGANESTAVITYVDSTKARAHLVYGNEKRTSVRLSDLQVRVKEGTLLKLQWTSENEHRITIIHSEIIEPSELEGVSYIQIVEGVIEKYETNPFAFIRCKNMNCYIEPKKVQKYKLCGNETVTALIVLDYNTKKSSWNWRCISLKKN